LGLLEIGRHGWILDCRVRAIRPLRRWGTRFGGRCSVLGDGKREAGLRVARECPPYHPTSKLVGTPISDDETVAKMGHPVLWLIETWAARPDDFSRERELRTPGLR
jgi:hypothetical protein